MTKMSSGLCRLCFVAVACSEQDEMKLALLGFPASNESSGVCISLCRAQIQLDALGQMFTFEFLLLGID